MIDKLVLSINNGSFHSCFNKKNPDINRKGGKGLIKNLSKPNKKCIVDSYLIVLVIKGEILFENLYTGYEASWCI